jgi:hypothetical protein
MLLVRLHCAHPQRSEDMDMTRYLLSVYEPGGPPPDSERLERIGEDLRVLNEEPFVRTSDAERGASAGERRAPSSSRVSARRGAGAGGGP